MNAQRDQPLRVVIIGPCASGKSTLKRALTMHGYEAIVAAQEHSAVPQLWSRSEPDVLIGLQADLEAIRLRRHDPRWSAAIWNAQQARLQSGFAQADFLTDTSGISVDAVVGTVLEFLAQIVHDTDSEVPDH
jgi:hypothetical protein